MSQTGFYLAISSNNSERNEGSATVPLTLEQLASLSPDTALILHTHPSKDDPYRHRIKQAEHSKDHKFTLVPNKRTATFLKSMMIDPAHHIQEASPNRRIGYDHFLTVNADEGKLHRTGHRGMALGSTGRRRSLPLEPITYLIDPPNQNPKK